MLRAKKGAGAYRSFRTVTRLKAKMYYPVSSLRRRRRLPIRSLDSNAAAWHRAEIRIMALPEAASLILGFTRTTRAALTVYPVVRTGAAVLMAMAVTLLYRGSAEGLYNILWAVVFGFATLNILSLAARRFEPERRGLTFGELMAVVVVLIALVLLGWEMLNLFHIFPIKIRR
jgi:hypothetical protein